METALSTGSGVLVEGGYVVTSAHVVWPYNSVRVVFPDGSEFKDAPVKGWDLLADVAVIGPMDASVSALTLADGEGLAIGVDMFLIGYPGEVEAFPQPTLVRGLLSRLREWKPGTLTFFQTDATIAGGQSGGALVSATGEVIGISGFGFTEGDFGLVASAGDLLPLVRDLIAGEAPSGLGERRVPLAGGKVRHQFQLANFWDERAYVISEPLGTNVEFRLTGINDGGITVYDATGGQLLFVDDAFTGAEAGSLTIEYDEPHFVVAWQLSENSGSFTLTSNRPLIPLHDQDDGRELRVGESVLANIDYPGDLDYFVIRLARGETVTITAQSALADTFLSIDYLGASGAQVIVDDDSGGGLFGLDAAVVYRAARAGSYFVIVEDVTGAAPGGYVLAVSRAGADAALTRTTLETLSTDTP